jgi:hypothetical protein
MGRRVSDGQSRTLPPCRKSGCGHRESFARQNFILYFETLIRADPHDPSRFAGITAAGPPRSSLEGRPRARVLS